MFRKRWLGHSCMAALIATGAAPSRAQEAAPSGTAESAAPLPTENPLRRGFIDPPQAARPRVWWHWINGNVEKDGARLDLEWMKRVGIGGFHVFSGGLPEPIVVKQAQPFMTEGWASALREAVGFGMAAGMEVGIAGSPGWSETGGPWVQPADGMKKYVWSETRVTGGRPLTEPLALPPIVTGPFQSIRRSGKGPELYRDTLVVAFRTPRAEEMATPEISSSVVGLDLGSITTKPLSSKVSLPVGDDGSAPWVEFRFPRPTLVSAVTLGLPNGASVEVKASADGKSYRSLGRQIVESTSALTHPLVQQTLAIVPTTASIFRVVLTPMTPPPPLAYGDAQPQPLPTPKKIDLSEVFLSGGARVNRFEAKAGFQPSVGVEDVSTPAAEAGAVIPRDGVIDLTSKLRSDGRLTWTPGPGDWTVLRYGWTLTGQTNGPAEPSATGLEVDKLDAAAVRRYIDTYLGMYEKATGGALEKGGISTLLTDSWEAGVQNWSPTILAEFRRRRGYDPVPFLPVLSGRVVESARASDGFLWDFRQTLKDVVADAHQSVLAKAINAEGMKYYTEVQGDTPRAIADGMTLKARSDIPTGEYWYRPFAAGPGQYSLKADLKEAASAAHVYGKPLAAAESLTVAAQRDPWAFSPAMLKPVVDEIFAHGINRILVHDSHHQPLPDAKPGLMLLFFGQFFNRNDTWAEYAKPWVDYLARSSFMLQQGQYVADVAYFYGEENSLTEIFRNRPNDDVPAGYAYDYVNPEALDQLLKVRDGKIVTPSGMNYGILFVPNFVRRYTPASLKRLRDLVADGAVVVATRPVGGLGGGTADAQVRRLADQLWGRSRAEGVRRFGKGRIYADIGSALSGEKIAADVSFAGRSTKGRLMTLHRRTVNADIFFVSNQASTAEDVTATFRVKGRAPEIWRAESGASEPATYQQSGGGTSVPLHLEPGEAYFVVFEKPATSMKWTAPRTVRTVAQSVEGPWDVTFEKDRGAPSSATFARLQSWTASSYAGVRYFSGTGTYTKNIDVPAAALGQGERMLLDLGDVRELARVSVNGVDVGTTWHSPYVVDVTRALKAGRNTLSIQVVNLWPNRLIGDKQPGTKPITFAPQSPYKQNSPLLPSGLLGPVRLLTEHR